MKEIIDKLIGVLGVFWLRDMWNNNHLLLNSSQLKVNIGVRVNIDWYFCVYLIKHIMIFAVDKKMMLLCKEPKVKVVMIDEVVS